MAEGTNQSGLRVKWEMEHKDGKTGRLLCRQCSVEGPGTFDFASKRNMSLYLKRARWYILLNRYHKARVEYVYSRSKGRDWTIPEKYRTGEKPPVHFISMIFAILWLEFGGRKWRKHCKEEQVKILKNRQADEVIA